jgi:hypothetical protein
MTATTSEQFAHEGEHASPKSSRSSRIWNRAQKIGMTVIDKSKSVGQWTKDKLSRAGHKTADAMRVCGRGMAVAGIFTWRVTKRVSLLLWYLLGAVGALTLDLLVGALMVIGVAIVLVIAIVVVVAWALIGFIVNIWKTFANFGKSFRGMMSADEAVIPPTVLRTPVADGRFSWREEGDAVRTAGEAVQPPYVETAQGIKVPTQTALDEWSQKFADALGRRLSEVEDGALEDLTDSRRVGAERYLGYLSTQQSFLTEEEFHNFNRSWAAVDRGLRPRQPGFKLSQAREAAQKEHNLLNELLALAS